MEFAYENNQNPDEKESDAEIQQQNKNESSALSNGRTDHNLIAVLSDEIVLGEVMRRVPWHKRPLFMCLSRSWGNALTHHFPSYARLDHPRILRNSLVLFRTPVGQSPSSSHETLALWIYSCENPNVVGKLPVPPIPKPLHINLKFVCDDDEERIYSFTLLPRCHVYNVNVLDLREGNSKWRRLPYLPVKEGQILFGCSYSPQKSTYVILTRTSIEPHAFWRWTLTEKNDTESQRRRQWQCQPVTGLHMRALKDFYADKMPPSYLEIKRVIRHRSENPVPIKHLYKRCDVYKCTQDTIWWGGQYVLMFQDQDGGDQRPSFTNSCYNLYHIEVSERVQLYKARVKDNSKRILEQSEWDGFSDLWRIEQDGGERSAMEVFVEGAEVVWVGQNRTSQINIEVAQKAGLVYIYRLLRISSPGLSMSFM